MREGNRYRELKLLEKAGKISHLRRQVKFELFPAQYEISTEKYTRGAKKGQYKRGKLLERECAYIADFVYHDFASNEVIVEDTKGMRTKDYIIKRKLMLNRHGIKIREV